MAMELAGATAFVTGGASGIGLGIARALAEVGARIAVADLRLDHLAAARDVAEEEGWVDRYLALPVDVTDRTGLAAAMDEAEGRLGPLRILVNNAGIGIAGPIAEATYGDWDWGLSVNLGGVVNGLVAGLPRLRAHGQAGHVVNTASLGAMMPPRPTRGIYATAKAGLIAMSEHLRLDLQGSGIGVSVLLPGPTASNIHESERARPDHLKAGSRFVENLSATRPPNITWQDPLIAGRMTVAAIREDRLYVVTHPEYLNAVRTRHRLIEQAIEQAILPSEAAHD